MISPLSVGATQPVLGRVLRTFVNLAHRWIAAFDAPMQVDSSFHVTGCLNIIVLINVAINVSPQGGDLAVTYLHIYILFQLELSE